MNEVKLRRTDKGHLDVDGVRRDKARAVAAHTGRPLIIYASGFLKSDKANLVGPDMLLGWADKDGFVEAIEGLDGDKVDVLVHSPGGIAEAADSIAGMLRSRFSDIRFIVPNIAKSAATMLVLSGDKILLDFVSELGPIDPQFNIRKGNGSIVVVPAQAIKDQFMRAQSEIAEDTKNLPAWIPILEQYGPALYQQADTAITFAKELVRKWLEEHMFRGEKDAKTSADHVAGFLGDHNNFRSHGRKIGLSEIRSIPALNRLKIVDYGKDVRLQSLIRDLYHAINITFDITAAFKLFENTEGRAFIQLAQITPVQVGPGGPPPGGPIGRKPSLWKRIRSWSRKPTSQGS